VDSTNSSSDSGEATNDEPRMVRIVEYGDEARYVYEFPERSSRVNVEHDLAKRVFRIMESNGRTAVFRDEPVRFLVVARSPQTGETMPVMRYGEPEYLYLCREERQRG
jgi:hypothetical protein